MDDNARIDAMYRAAERFLRFEVKAGGYPCHARWALELRDKLTELLSHDGWTPPDRHCDSDCLHSKACEADYQERDRAQDAINDAD